tara:strand:+ start:567 stop:1241 length:675 start_codon:yes stop_codon:yes gene_type:complete
MNNPPGVKVNTPKNINVKPSVGNINTSSNISLLYIKFKPYIPYLIGFIFIISLVFLIYLVISMFLGDDTGTGEDSEDTEGTEGTEGSEGSEGSESGEGGGGTSRRSRSGSSRNFIGNRSLDSIYNDAGGNEVLSNAQLISNVNLSTDEYSCSYLITYTGNNERQVQCMSGCDENNNTSENVEFCSKYRYRDGSDNSLSGDLGDTFLDQTYIGRRGARRNTGGGG